MPRGFSRTLSGDHLDLLAPDYCVMDQIVAIDSDLIGILLAGQFFRVSPDSDSKDPSEPSAKTISQAEPKT